MPVTFQDEEVGPPNRTFQDDEVGPPVPASAALESPQFGASGSWEPDSIIPPATEDIIPPPRAVTMADVNEGIGSGLGETGLYGIQNEAARLGVESDFPQTPIIPPGAIRAGAALATLGTSELVPFLADKVLPKPAAQFVRGLKTGAEETFASFTSPEAMAILPAFAIPYVGRAMALYMGGHATHESTKEFFEAIYDEDYDRAGKAIPGLAIGVGMVKHGIAGKKKLTKPSDGLELAEKLSLAKESPEVVSEFGRLWPKRPRSAFKDNGPAFQATLQQARANVREGATQPAATLPIPVPPITHAAAKKEKPLDPTAPPEVPFTPVELKPTLVPEKTVEPPAPIEKVAGEVASEVKPVEEPAVVPEKAEVEILDVKPDETQRVQPEEGPGAMTAGELDPVKPQTTSNKLRLMEQRREELGLPKQDPVLRYSNQEALDYAKVVIDENPLFVETLLEEVGKKPRALYPHEEAALNIYRAELNIELERGLKNWREAFEGNDYIRAAEESGKVDSWRDKIDKLDDITGKGGTGTEAGRSLQARKMALDEQFRLARMDVEARQAKGEDLTPKEQQTIIDLNKRITDLQDQLNKSREGKVEEGRRVQVGEDFDETVQKVRQEKATGKPVDSVTQGENIIDRMRKRIEEGDTAEDLYAYVQKLHENLQRQAIDMGGPPLSRVEVVDAIHNILTKDLGLTLPKEFTGIERVANTSDLISGIGRATKLTTDSAKLAKMDIREQEQKIGKINRYLNKMAAPKTGQERKKSSAEARQLEKEGRKLARDLGIQVTDPATQLANSLTAIKTRLRNEIEELDLAIASHKPMVRDKGGVAYDTEATALKAQRDAKKADYDALFPKEPLTDAQRIVIAEKVIDRQIAEIEGQLKTGAIFPPGKKPSQVPRDAALDAKRARLEALKLEREYARELIQPKVIRTPEEIALQSWRTRTVNRVATLKEKLAKSDFVTKKREPFQPTSREDLQRQADLKVAKTEYLMGLHKWRMARRSVLRKIGDAAQRARGAFVNIASSFDLSAPRQALTAILANTTRLVTNPIRGAKMLGSQFGKMFSALWNENNARLIEQKIQDRPNAQNGADKLAGIEYSDLETQKFTKYEENAHSILDEWAKSPYKTGNLAKTLATAPLKVPIRGVRASNRAFVTFLNATRADLFDELLRVNFKDRAPTELELKAIGNLVNVTTGRGKLNPVTSQRLSEVLWSPKLLASRIQALAGQPFYGGNAKTRGIVAKEYARVIAGGYVLWQVSRLFDEKKEEEPTSSDYGKVVRGDVRIDPWGGFQQLWVLFNRIFRAESTSLNGKTSDIGADKKFGQRGIWHTLADFGRSKARPDLGAAIDFVSRQNVIGEPWTPGMAGESLLVPLPWRDVIGIMKAQGYTEGMITEALGLFGAGVSNYEDREGQR